MANGDRRRAVRGALSTRSGACALCFALLSCLILLASLGARLNDDGATVYVGDAGDSDAHPPPHKRRRRKKFAVTTADSVETAAERPAPSPAPAPGKVAAPRKSTPKVVARPATPATVSIPAPGTEWTGPPGLWDTPPPSNGVAPLILSTLPHACLDNAGLNWNRDAECYFTLASEVEAALAENPWGPYCWGSSGVAPPEPALLVHAATLTPLPPGFPLYIHSFLATQCCDAVMWMWVPAPLMDSVRAQLEEVVPSHAVHRVLLKEMDLASEWGNVASDFPSLNATSVAAVAEWEDLRFITDWWRMLVMYAYGGTWFDVDTVFLRDLRPVTAAAAQAGWSGWWYRAGESALSNNAAFTLAQRPDPISHALILAAVKERDPRPKAVSHWLFNKGQGHSHVPGKPILFCWLSQVLFDALWPRILPRVAPTQLAGIHPELHANNKYTTHYSRSWFGFFATVMNDTSVPTVGQVRARPFLPGSFTYHWWVVVVVVGFGGCCQSYTGCLPSPHLLPPPSLSPGTTVTTWAWDLRTAGRGP